MFFFVKCTRVYSLVLLNRMFDGILELNSIEFYEMKYLSQHTLLDQHTETTVFSKDNFHKGMVIFPLWLPQSGPLIIPQFNNPGLNDY